MSVASSEVMIREVDEITQVHNAVAVVVAAIVICEVNIREIDEV
jgi:hypothetical protein